MDSLLLQVQLEVPWKYLRENFARDNTKVAGDGTKAVRQDIKVRDYRRNTQVTKERQEGDSGENDEAWADKE